MDERKMDINRIFVHKDLREYQYMCERNNLRMLLIGLGIEEPLLLMRCAIYLSGKDFYQSGSFSTFFGRNMLNPDILPILGEEVHALDWEKIDSYLQDGFLIMANVDVFELPYKKSTYYKRKHAAHNITIINKCKDGYSILDWYHPDYFYGFISKDDLERARLSSNQADGLSAFSGCPIRAAYKCLNINKIPMSIEIKKCIIINMIASIRSLSDTEDGGIIFWKSLLVRKPEWLQEKMLQCDNFIKSLFIFELEIQLLLKYLQAIKVNNLFDENKVNATIDVVCHLYESVHFFKGKVLFSIKRKREIGLESWKKMVGSVGEDLSSYCSKAMDMFIS